MRSPRVFKSHGSNKVEVMKLSIVIPCYNELDTIEEIVQAVKNAPIDEKEIIIVDDCSTDGTRDVLEEKIKPQFTTKSIKEKGQRCALDSAKRPVMWWWYKTLIWSTTRRSILY